MKKTLYSEAAYVLGLLALAVGTAMMERADYGISMVVAPAYLVYMKISTYYSWFTFGMAEYCFQAVLIVVLTIVIGKFKKKYLLSFVTAFVYGNILDLMMRLIALVPGSGIAFRIVFYIVGLVFCAIGVSLLFHTYIAPEAYELFVKELAEKHMWSISRVKTVYDCCSCMIAILMSFAFFGLWHFEGVKGGTLICAVINGWLIGKCSSFFEDRFDFRDAFTFRKYL